MAAIPFLCNGILLIQGNILSIIKQNNLTVFHNQYKIKEKKIKNIYFYLYSRLSRSFTARGVTSMYPHEVIRLRSF